MMKIIYYFVIFDIFTELTPCLLHYENDFTLWSLDIWLMFRLKLGVIANIANISFVHIDLLAEVGTHEARV